MLRYVCPSTCPLHMEQLGCHWTDFYKICYLSTFWKSVLKIQVSVKPDKNGRCSTRKLTSRSVLLRMTNVSENKICRENQNTHFTLNNFLRKSCGLWGNVEKIMYCPSDHGRQYNKSHAFWVLDNWRYRHTFRIRMHTDKNNLRS
jgi:hypothetical protein